MSAAGSERFPRLSRHLREIREWQLTSAPPPRGTPVRGCAARTSPGSHRHRAGRGPVPARYLRAAIPAGSPERGRLRLDVTDHGVAARSVIAAKIAAASAAQPRPIGTVGGGHSASLPRHQTGSSLAGSASERALGNEAALWSSEDLPKLSSSSHLRMSSHPGSILRLFSRRSRCIVSMPLIALTTSTKIAGLPLGETLVRALSIATWGSNHV